MKTLLVSRWERRRSEQAFVAAILDQLDAEFLPVEDGWPAGSLFRGFDRVVYFVRFRDLAVEPPVDWGSFSGSRVMVDHDAYNNYPDLGQAQGLLGQWPVEFRRHRFDLLICSGREVTERLCRDDINARWVPKGYDPALFHDEQGERNGWCTFGTLWRARAAMFTRIRSADVALQRLSVPYEQLGTELNRFIACIVCNMGAKVRLGKLGRFANRRWPGILTEMLPGIEPMIKNFEAAAAGCAVFADWIPELEQLGFIDGENVVFYRDLDELVEKVRDADDQRLRIIGSAGATLAASRHTWRHRAEQIHALTY